MPFEPPLLISASRRTDIPAFYAKWFARRLAEGHCHVANPFSGRKYRVSLAPRDVLGWVFWSRNYAPFLDIAKDLHAAGQRALYHLTITGMPRVLEPRTIAADRATEIARQLADAFGPRAVVWRYDPILLTSATPSDWHRRNFAQLAEALRGSVRRCIFSFPTMYQKARRNLAKLEEAEPEFRAWREGQDFEKADLRRLAADLSGMARACDMDMRVCCGEEWADAEAGIATAACVDWPLLRDLGAGRHLADTEGDLFGDAIPEPKPCPSRTGCGCYRCADIGAYQTCAHGCAYCYAVDDPARAQDALRAHDVDAEKL